MTTKTAQTVRAWEPRTSTATYTSSSEFWVSMYCIMTLLNQFIWPRSRVSDNDISPGMRVNTRSILWWCLCTLYLTWEGSKQKVTNCTKSASYCGQLKKLIYRYLILSHQSPMGLGRMAWLQRSTLQQQLSGTSCSGQIYTSSWGDPVQLMGRRNPRTNQLQHSTSSWGEKPKN